MAVERVSARVFGEVADVYDRVRPGYPSALIDDVLGYADLHGAPALEVGAGTGKATGAFVERGVAVTAVEPDAAMAAVLARRFPDPESLSTLWPSTDLRGRPEFGDLVERLYTGERVVSTGDFIARKIQLRGGDS